MGEGISITSVGLELKGTCIYISIETRDRISSR